MNIYDAATNLNIHAFTPQSAWDKLRAMPTSAELMVMLIQKSVEHHPAKTAQGATGTTVDTID